MLRRPLAGLAAAALGRPPSDCKLWVPLSGGSSQREGARPPRSSRGACCRPAAGLWAGLPRCCPRVPPSARGAERLWAPDSPPRVASAPRAPGGLRACAPQLLFSPAPSVPHAHCFVEVF